jgi:hypothetical protein
MKFFPLLNFGRQHEALDTNSIASGEESDSMTCDGLEKHCPLSLLELSPYTDV